MKHQHSYVARISSSHHQHDPLRDFARNSSSLPPMRLARILSSLAWARPNDHARKNLRPADRRRESVSETQTTHPPPTVPKVTVKNWQPERPTRRPRQGRPAWRPLSCQPEVHENVDVDHHLTTPERLAHCRVCTCTRHRTCMNRYSSKTDISHCLCLFPSVPEIANEP